MSNARSIISVALLTTVALGMVVDPGKAQEQVCVSKRDRIVGGEEAAIQDWPSQAALRVHSDTGQVSDYFCGGTAISERWVLTAAHCLPEYVSKLTGPVKDSKGQVHQGRLEVVLGAEDLTQVRPDQVFALDEVIIHERYRAAIDKALRIADPKERARSLARISCRP